MSVITAKESATEPMDGLAFRNRFQELLQSSLQVFHHYSGLESLSRQLTFLSFNAGFASFQAGESGVTVNVLTQFTRTMSQRLNGVHREILELRSKAYQVSASVLSSLQRVFVLGSARARVATRAGDLDGDGDEMRRTITLAARSQENEMFGFVRTLLNDVDKLDGLGAEIADIVQQIDSIAILMAIEAGVVGDYGEEFRWVADNIRSDVERLAKMVKSASSSCNLARSRGEQLMGMRISEAL